MLPYILGAIAGFLLGLLPGLVLGLRLRDIQDKLVELLNRPTASNKADKQPPKEKTLFAEPMDPLQFAAFEQQEKIRQLNE